MTAIPFTRGVPSADMLPVADLEQAAVTALREDGARALAYSPGGYMPLREWIGERHRVDPARVLVVRYREIVEEPRATVDRVCAFLGIAASQLEEIPRDNVHTYAEPGWRTDVFGPAVRAGAWLGQFAPPQLWRRASAPRWRTAWGCRSPSCSR